VSAADDYEPTAAAVRRFAAGLLMALPPDPPDVVADRIDALLAEVYTHPGNRYDPIGIR
jgi:hypothetical protein